MFLQLLFCRGSTGEPGQRLSLFLIQLLPWGLAGFRPTRVAFEIRFPFQCLLTCSGSAPRVLEEKFVTFFQFLTWFRIDWSFVFLIDL